MARTIRRALVLAGGALLLGGLSGFGAGQPASATSDRPGPGAAAASQAATSFQREPAAARGDGLVFRVRGSGGGTVYLAGSMHLLRPGDSALPATFDAAYRDAERLVMEIDLDDVDPAAAAAFTTSHATYGAGQGLRQALGERRWQRARVAFESIGLQLESLDRLEPWAVALLYSVSSMTGLGFEPGLGVEEQLKARALADHKPIDGLERIEDQLGLFDALPPEEQARLLELTLEDSATSVRDIDALTRAWRRGDARALARLLLREYRHFPSLYEPLVYGRNRNWLPRLEALLQRDDDSLVVVGAMHLVGERGVVELLRQRGHVVEPLRTH
ncbi:MAG: TraB/GumN family protein [Steroidobacteraceae bacterium]